uniref:Uncharacterized protein n=1 Tax=Candidatus Kentrum sp. DK TaxID=2126562 RepID=A0A450SCC0_9GAMM|nr:MAG: hypothetical protein BECKDK2373B_GA0170837_102644 [Candidatus Kentron sp. DK]
MNSIHPLLQRARTYPRSNIDLSPPGCEYDDAVGAWRIMETGQLWAETPERVGPATKKFDIETGEDQKGE